MKKLLFLLLVCSVGLSAQTALTKNYLGQYSATKIKTSSATTGDTSATFQLGSDMIGFAVMGSVTVGKTTFVTQAAPAYNATQSSMLWSHVDSLVGSTGNSVKVLLVSYPYIRVIRNTWGSTSTSSFYVFPIGGK